ncbi:uncharacterized protein [Euphorbia lathyris]|uniref:uncharacterized protein n=1 Tax=Euphorbia lathyris TaxID=212925 RepID=UPI003313C3B2
MACLEMYNPDQHKHHNCPPISPRISFSNDFVDSQQILRNPSSSSLTRSDASVSSDFEFSVSNYSMMSADELFSKGRLLPFKNNSNQTQRTIRDELSSDDDHHHKVSARPPKGRWKGLLGLKRTHIAPKKIDNNDKILENTPPKNSQEYLSNEGGSSNRDVEIGI